jgi:hypothetical protein
MGAPSFSNEGALPVGILSDEPLHVPGHDVGIIVADRPVLSL